MAHEHHAVADRGHGGRPDFLHRRLLVVVALLSIAAAVGMAVLWPPSGGAAPQERAPLYDGVIRSAAVTDCPTDGFAPVRPPCILAEVEIVTGPDRGVRFEVDTGAQGYPPFAAGEAVKVVASDGPDGTIYGVSDYDRLNPLLVLLLVFVVAVVAAGRWHGLRSLLGLGVSLAVISQFFVPAIVAGRSPLAVAVVGAFAIMLATLYLSHGVSIKTTAALLGTAVALTLTSLVGVVFAAVARLTGLASEDTQLLAFAVQGVDLRGLVLAGIVIGSLGVLDDVTVAQASTVFALHDVEPTQTRGVLFRRAMSVGRDHIASTVNTLVLAYTGASIPLLLLFSTGGLPFAEIVNTELVAEEIVTTLVGSLGLIAAVPITTALAAAVATGSVGRPGPRGRPPAEPSADQEWIKELRAAAGDLRRDEDRSIGAP